MNNEEIPKSTFNNNTYDDFLNICKGYNNELLHISKLEFPTLSKDDTIVIDNLIKEIYKYSSELIVSDFVDEAKNIINVGLEICNQFENIYTNISSNDENFTGYIYYPVTLRLMLLESLFNVYFKYERNFVEAEKIINEIKDIQNYLQLPHYNYACTLFYSSLICFYKKDFENCEKLLNESLVLIENESKNNKKQSSNDNIYDNKTIRTMSNILDFMGELYTLKKDYLKVINCYEKAYYLNMGRYGSQDSSTEYFKIKLNMMNDKIKNYFPFSQTSNFSINNINNTFKNTNGNNKTNMSNSNLQYSTYSQMMNSNILHKGKSDTFSFKIPTSSLYEPFIISLYKLSEDTENNYLSKLYIGNITFDKTKLINFLGEQEGNNSIFYTDDSLNQILTNIVYINGFVTFLDINLKNSMINSSVKIKNFPKK